MNKNRGRFITFEGTEGVGKTTQIERVADYLNELGYQVIKTREPGGTELGEKIRELLLYEEMYELTELLLMFAARAEHIHQIINPALKAGVWVLCDRFTESSYAYQGYGRQLSLETIRKLEEMVQETLRPDMTLWFDMTVEKGLKRLQRRSNIDRIEKEKLDFFMRVHEGFKQLALERSSQIVRVNADESVDQVTKQIIQALTKFI